MAKSSSSSTSSVYDFDPGHAQDQGERYITLEANDSGEVIILSTQNDGEPAVSHILKEASQEYDWGTLVSEILTAEYLSQLIATLRDNSALIDLVTNLLFQHFELDWQGSPTSLLGMQMATRLTPRHRRKMATVKKSTVCPPPLL